MSDISPPVRSAIPGDAPRLAVLGLQVWLHTYAWNGISDSIAHYVQQEFTTAQFEALIADPTSQVTLLEQGENIIAYITLNHGKRFVDEHSGVAIDVATEVATLYVQAHFLRKGLGQRLLDHACAELAQAGRSPALWLKVNAQNLNAQRFYLAQVFVQEGETDFMLDGVAHRNWVMVKR